MQTLKRNKVAQLVGILLLTLLAGCPEWNSHPVVVERDFGNSARNMVKNQTLYPEHGQNDKPVLGMDGQKAQGVIKAYRVPASEPLEKAKDGAEFDMNVGK